MNYQNEPLLYDVYASFLKALYFDTPKAPCEDCPFWKDCKENSLACYDFYTYIKRGTFRELTKDRVRNPTFRWFRKIFLLSKLAIETN